MLKDRFRHNWGLFLVIILSFWTIKPLFHNGFFPMHDDTQVVRVQQAAKALSDGHFPVRWSADLGYGYGYPIFNFYSPLPYYFGGLLNLLGFDALTATKMMFVFGILLAGLAMYFFARNLWGEWGGFLSAILYQYTPYHALDIYVRGAVGEFWAMAFLPLVFYGIYKVGESVNEKRTISSYSLNIGAIGYAGVILSHSITAMLLTFILAPLLLIVFLTYKNRQLILNLLIMFSIGLLLSAFFVLPAVFEMKYADIDSIIGGSADFRKHFVFLDQLWNWPWGFAGSAPGREDGMSFKIGKMHLILAFLGAVLIIIKSKLRSNKKTSFLTISGFLFVLLIFSAFMTTKSSQFIWEAFPFLEYTQYPWRFLTFTAFSASFLGGAIVLTSKNKATLITAVSLAVLTIFLNAKYFQPQKYLSVNSGYYISEENIKWHTSNISDEYLPSNFPKPENEGEIVKDKFIGTGAVSFIEKEVKTQRHFLSYEAKENQDLIVETAYFPGWQMFLDEKPIDFFIYKGRMKVSIPTGRHNLLVVFENTPIRTIANSISLLSFIFIFGKIIRRGKDWRSNEQTQS